MEHFDYYIASGFFTPESLQVVKDQESFYDEEGIKYFSPRSITMDLSPNNPDREKNAKILFNKDLEMIHVCDHMHAIIDKSLDKGTLFEVGYMTALILRGEKDPESLEFHYEDIDNQFIREFTDSLLALWFSEDQYKKMAGGRFKSSVFVADSNHISDLEFIINLYNMAAIAMPISSNIDPESIMEQINAGKQPIIVTDEIKGQRCMELYILMGFLKGLDIPFYTASIREYGSNIMIASSTQGHLNLPAIVNPYNSKMVIE